MGPKKRAVLRSLVMQSEHESRDELAGLLAATAIEVGPNEAQLLAAVSSQASPPLTSLITAVVAYEELARLIEATFRTLCAVSYSLGARPMTPGDAQRHHVIERCATELPDRYRAALEALAAVGMEPELEERLGDFGLRRSAADLVELAMRHHEGVQEEKPPAGKRPWFEPVRNGWIVRGAHGARVAPDLDRLDSCTRSGWRHFSGSSWRPRREWRPPPGPLVAAGRCR
jgi:hypothetical protein